MKEQIETLILRNKSAKEELEHIFNNYEHLTTKEKTIMETEISMRNVFISELEDLL